MKIAKFFWVRLVWPLGPGMVWQVACQYNGLWWVCGIENPIEPIEIGLELPYYNPQDIAA